MKNVFFLTIAVLLVVFGTTAFQCSSAEMTSAKMYMQRSEWANAEKSLEQELSKNPNNAEAWYMLGRVRLEQKNYEGMNEAFSRSLGVSNLHEKDIKGARLSVWAQLFNGGVDLYVRSKKAQGDSVGMMLDKAIDNFRIAIIINPDSAGTYQNLGLAYLAKDDFAGAVKNFEISLTKEKDPILASSVGNLYLDRGKKFQAQAQTADGSQKDSLSGLAKENFTKAIATLEEARQWDPDNSEAVGTLLDAYVAAGRTDEAMNNFKLAVERNPNNKLYRYNYGVLLLKAGDYKGAIDQFEAAAVIDPQFEDGLYNLGVSYLQSGAKLRSQEDPKSKNKSSKVYEDLFKKSRETLERLKDLRPNDPEVWEALGQAYANLNMQKMASEAFTKADAIRKGK